MLYIGISEEHDAGVSVLYKGEIVFAVNEERLVRQKFYVGFPHKSLALAIDFLRENGWMDKIEGIGLASQIHVENVDLAPRASLLYVSTHYLLNILLRWQVFAGILGSRMGLKIARLLYQLLQSGRKRRIRAHLAMYGLADLPLEFFDHHVCHSMSGYFTSGFGRCMTLTLDAAGDGYCSKIYKCEAGSMQEIHTIPFFHSIGYYYVLVTLILEFKIGQEGKVTGLAARGDARKAIHIFRQKIPYNSAQMSFQNHGRFFLFELELLKASLSMYSREDIAAAMQLHLEETVCEYVQDSLEKFYPEVESIDIALSGGIFANVLLNQKISQVGRVGRVFIHPHMGDGGLASGAAFAMHKATRDLKPYEIKHVYLGCEFTHDAIEDAIERSGFSYQKLDDIESHIATLLANCHVVARFDGPMEYGPRALGNRSILFHAGDKRVNMWLNNRLKRSEFMPFAPVVLQEDVDEYFHVHNQYLAAKFMTMTFRATEKCKKLCPAVVHVDGTARPQIVNSIEMPSYHRIIYEYKKLTGVPVIINTSFNMHEEPIVDSPLKALDAFSRADLDYLAIGPYIVKKTV